MTGERFTRRGASMNPNAVPVAYVRKSTRGGPDSKADQITGARELAARHGDGDRLVILDGDWGVSAAREKTAKRLDFLRLMSEVEAGRVSAIYATDADRLARSLRWAAQLGDACRDHGVLIHTPVRTFDLSDEADLTIWQFAAMTNEAEVRKMQRKAETRVQRQRERGSPMGQAPYGAKDGEDVQVVLDAFRKTRSYSAAARFLNKQGVPSRRSHIRTAQGVAFGWSGSTVREIVRRANPEKVPARPHARSRTLATHAFTRLLLCPVDGSVLTSQTSKRGFDGYACRLARTRPDHLRPSSIREEVVMEWARKEVAYILSLTTVAERADGVEESVTALRNRLTRYGTIFADGVIPEEVYRAKKAEIEAEIEALAGSSRIKRVINVGVDWSAPPEIINAALRDVLVGIRLTYVDAEEGASGRHASLDQRLVPSGGVWKRRPMTLVGEYDPERVYEDGDGPVQEPHPLAEPFAGGWFLPTLIGADE